MTARLVLITALLGASQAHANPVDAFGFGSRGPALANALTADVEDASANIYNPAGLVRGRQMHIDIAYRYAHAALKMNGADQHVDPSSGLAVGLAAPTHIGPFRFAIGVALWLPDGRLTRLRSLPPEQPRWVLYDNRMQRLVLQANLAIQIVPGLYVAAGMTFMSRTTGSVKLKGTLATGAPDDSSLVTDINVDLVAVRYPQAGILWDINRNLSLGLTYRHSFQLDTNLDFRIDGNVGDPPIVTNGFFAAKTHSLDHFQPWQLTLGGAARLHRRVKVLVDFTYARWSEAPTPISDLTLSLDVGIFQSRVKLPPPRYVIPANFHDILISRLGVEWLAHDGARVGVDARFGYSYEPTPVPEQIGDASLADSDKHTFSIGAGVELRRLQPTLVHPLTIDVHLAVTGLPDRANRKLLPLDKTGDFVAGGALVSVGLGLRSKF